MFPQSIFGIKVIQLTMIGFVSGMFLALSRSSIAFENCCVKSLTF